MHIPCHVNKINDLLDMVFMAYARPIEYYILYTSMHQSVANWQHIQPVDLIEVFLLRSGYCMAVAMFCCISCISSHFKYVVF